MTVKFLPLFPPVQYFYTPMAHTNTTLRQLSLDGLTTVSATYAQIIECLETTLDTPNTYNAIRSDINLLCNYCWFVLKKDIIEMTYKDMQGFIDFCNSPPADMTAKGPQSIALAKHSDEDHIELNPAWQPFVNRNAPQAYKRTKGSLKAQLSNLSFVYVYFEDVEYAFRNPAAVALRRMTSSVNAKLRVSRSEIDDKGLSQLQLKYLLLTVNKLAKVDPDTHERTRFLIYLLVFAYPRLSECSARPGYSPIQSDFRVKRSSTDNTTFTTFWIPDSKGGKSRNVLCSKHLIQALERYRTFLGLTLFPSPDENIPLFVRHKAASHGREARIVDANLGSDRIAEIVKSTFNAAADALVEDGYSIDADDLRTHTTHSLRHTGIQIDISSGRKLSDIMLDAGHSNPATLAIYTSKRAEFRAKSIAEKDTYMSELTNNASGGSVSSKATGSRN
ncbi:site-specific integrase [Vibrio mediterranei]|uniref:hypothetical protein n=1 Tax=Vibrio mediterranei TaxID=689 RepID=UPI0038CE199C